MKTISLLKIATVILLGIALSGQVQAKNDKYTRVVRLAPVQTEFEMRLNEAISHHLRHLFAQPVEDWMFDTEYLSEETAVPIESWMFETDYLNEDVQPLESWMFSETRLDGTESEKSSSLKDGVNER